MKRFALMMTLFVVGMVVPCQTVSAGMITVDFDDVSKWQAGSGNFATIQSNHVYVDQGFRFTGGPAFRNSTAVQDGVAGALVVCHS